MTDIPDAAFAAAHEDLLSDDLADVAQAAEETLRDHSPRGADEEIAAETDPVLANAPRTPRRGSFQERIDQVTRARREAERERDYWRETAARAPQAAAFPQPQVQAEDVHPHPADYPQGEADPGFLRDVARLEARQELAQVIQDQVTHHHAALVEQAWNGRQAEFAKTAPDYYAAFDREWACSEVMADAIRTSDEGPAVAYHLAQNPAEAARIYSLPPMAQVRAMGRIEASVGRAAGGHSHNPAVSNAPAPPPQARGAGARFRVSPDTDDFASFDRAY